MTRIQLQYLYLVLVVSNPSILFPINSSGVEAITIPSQMFLSMFAGEKLLWHKTFCSAFRSNVVVSQNPFSRRPRELLFMVFRRMQYIRRLLVTIRPKQVDNQETWSKVDFDVSDDNFLDPRSYVLLWDKMSYRTSKEHQDRPYQSSAFLKHSCNIVTLLAKEEQDQSATRSNGFFLVSDVRFFCIVKDGRCDLDYVSARHTQTIVQVVFLLISCARK